MIARGVRRLLRARGFSSLTELPLTDGRRADIAAVNRDGEVLIVEVKSSPADFRADRKWRDYAACCDRLYFAISERTPAEPDAARGGPHRRRSLWRGNRARSRIAAHGSGQPPRGFAALRPGGGRPAAPSGGSGGDAGILIGKRPPAPRSADVLERAGACRQKERAASRRPLAMIREGGGSDRQRPGLRVPAERRIAESCKAKTHHRPGRRLRSTASERARRNNAELEGILGRGERHFRERRQDR